MPRDLDSTPTFTKDAKWFDFVNIWKWDSDWKAVRLFGPVWTDYRHTVKTKSGKAYWEYCHGWDMEKEEFFPDREARCACCSLKLPGQHRYYMNLICKETEENKPQKPKADWSPVFMIDMAPSLLKKIKEFKGANKGFAVSDTLKGATILVKFDENADPANMYGVTLDEKNTPITDEQKKYTVHQKYPDGSVKIIKGQNGLPGMWEYIRCVNSRDSMLRSLRAHGHLVDNSQALSPAQSQSNVDSVQIEAIQEIDLDIPFGDPSPAPEAKKKEEPVSSEPCIECPTEFGNFANSIECYTKCTHLMDACRTATLQKNPAPAEGAKAVLDEDDSV